VAETLVRILVAIVDDKAGVIFGSIVVGEFEDAFAVGEVSTGRG